MKVPGALQVDVLLAVAQHDDEAYGLLVREEVSGVRGRQYSVGAIYTTLSRLEAKGLLSSRTTAPLPIRGGRSRRQYRLTAAARTVLAAERERTLRRWSSVPLTGQRSGSGGPSTLPGGEPGTEVHATENP